MTNSYALFYQNEFSDLCAKDHNEAIERVLDILVEDGHDRDSIVVADQWDADGENFRGCKVIRLLFWATEADAKDDPGANAVAALTTTEEC